jgi:serine/threonine-protein kinase
VRVTISTGPAQAAVPSVVGLTRTQALAKLSSHGFKPVLKLQSSVSVLHGTAIGTIPAQGANADLDRPITLLVSSGPTQVRVPDVTGSTKEAASAELTAAGFKLGAVTEKVSKAHPPGTVLSQAPAGGALASSGSEVSLVMASAPKQVVVPSVVGETAETAVETLQSAEFAVSQTASPVPDTLLVGLVVKQSPAAGHRVRRGASVALVIGAAETSTTTSSTTSSSSSTTQTTTSSSTTEPAGPP